MNPTLETAIQICRMIEESLRLMHCHCGITGSQVYGMGKKHDIDILIYGHNEKNGRILPDPERILIYLKAMFPGARYGTVDGYNNELIKATYANHEIDFIIL